MREAEREKEKQSWRSIAAENDISWEGVDLRDKNDMKELHGIMGIKGVAQKSRFRLFVKKRQQEPPEDNGIVNDGVVEDDIPPPEDDGIVYDDGIVFDNEDVIDVPTDSVEPEIVYPENDYYEDPEFAPLGLNAGSNVKPRSGGISNVQRNTGGKKIGGISNVKPKKGGISNVRKPKIGGISNDKPKIEVGDYSEEDESTYPEEDEFAFPEAESDAPDAIHHVYPMKWDSKKIDFNKNYGTQADPQLWG